jgi:hypothetical protein
METKLYKGFREVSIDAGGKKLAWAFGIVGGIGGASAGFTAGFAAGRAY